MAKMAIALVLLSVFAAATAQKASPEREVITPVKGMTPWTPIFRSGDVIGDSKMPVGTILDQDGNALGGDEGVSNDPDISTLQHVDEQMFIVTQFESPNPAVAYITKLDQEDDGKLTPTATAPVDFSEWGGLWVPCAGSHTPWNTHAGGEEYEPDGFCWDMSTSLDGPEATSYINCTGGGYGGVMSMLQYFGISEPTWEDVKEYFNPYKYGHAFEIAVTDADGSYTATKHYAMGRLSYELYYVMPDNKTVYMTDDGSQTAFWKFVADVPGDLSAGTLYGAKMNQMRDDYGGAFEVSWIELGSANQAELVEMVMNNITFSDIWEYKQWSAENGCPKGFTVISQRDQGPGTAECLKLKEGQEKAAAFLESRRYLAYNNGTVEFSKWEGITFDPATMSMYTAMSNIRYGMEDNMKKGENDTQYDDGGSNDVRIPFNPCGCTYRLKVDESYTVTEMTGMLCGAVNPQEGNACDTNLPSEPDNVAFITGQDSLIIGEDTNAKTNDIMWQYVPATGELTRIMSVPYGAETTGPLWYQDLNGFAYLLASSQHPYGEMDQDKIEEEANSGLSGWVGAWAMPADNFANGERLRFGGIPLAMGEQRHSVMSSTWGYTLGVAPTFNTVGGDRQAKDKVAEMLPEVSYEVAAASAP